VSIRYGSDDGGRPRVTTTVQGGNETTVTYDMLGRQIQTQWRAFGGQLAQSETAYDHLGRTTSISVPHFLGDAIRYHTVEYDLLGRVLTERNPDATSKRYEYRGLEQRAWDEKNNESYLVLNEVGLVARSVQVEPGGRLLTTRYEYGPFNLLEQVT